MASKTGIRGWPGTVRPVRATYLYDRGNEFMPLTGGWTQAMATGGSTTKNPDNLQINAPGSNSVGCTFAPLVPLDFSQFSRMYVMRKILDSTNAMGFGLIPTRTGHWTSGPVSITFQPGGSDPNEILMVLDISPANGLYYASFGATGDNFSQGGGTVQMTRMWLE